MTATLVLLAVTAMKTGVCVAGVRQQRPNEWVRPVRDFGSVLLGDITYPPAAGSTTRRVMRPFDVVELALGRARPDPPHIEDWTCDFAHVRPRLLGSVAEAERAAILDAAATTPAAVWDQGQCSLGTIAVSQLTAHFSLDSYTGRYEARLSTPELPGGLTASVPCTDLKWRALGRRLLAERSGSAEVRALALDGDALDDALGGPRRYWLALGVSRAHDGRHWPLIVGVHTLPEYEADVEYSSL